MLFIFVFKYKTKSEQLDLVKFKNSENTFNQKYG